MNRWKELTEEISQLALIRDNLFMLATDTASHLTGMPRSGSPELQKNQSLVAEREDIEGRINGLVAEADGVRKEIGDMIRRIQNPMHEKVMILIYLENKNYSEITKMTLFRSSTIYKIKIRCLGKIEDMLEREKKDLHFVLVNGREKRYNRAQ